MTQGASMRTRARESVPRDELGRRRPALSIQVSEAVNEWLRITAAAEHRSVSAQIAYLLERAMAEREG